MASLGLAHDDIDANVPISELLEEAAGILSDNNLNVFFDDLERGKLAASNDSAFKENLKAIDRFSKEELTVSSGNTSERYDVILQPGHFWRTSGITGTGGKLVYERNLVAYITKIAAEYLQNEGVKTLVIPADSYQTGLRAKAFLAIHADGNEKSLSSVEGKCFTGPSMGYDDQSDLLGVHSVGYGLATALNKSYDQFMKDGFTRALREYYAFSDIITSRFEGVLEIGDLTCARDENLLIENADKVGRNIARMLVATVEVE